jgi:hypothetical protein
MKSLKEIIEEGIDFKNLSISIVQDEKRANPLTVEDLKRGSHFSVCVRPDEDKEVSIISAFTVKDDLTVEPVSGVVISKGNVELLENSAHIYWKRVSDITKLKTQIARLVTKLLKERQQQTNTIGQ